MKLEKDVTINQVPVGRIIDFISFLAAGYAQSISDDTLEEFALELLTDLGYGNYFCKNDNYYMKEAGL